MQKPEERNTTVDLIEGLQRELQNTIDVLTVLKGRVIRNEDIMGPSMSIIDSIMNSDEIWWAIHNRMVRINKERWQEGKNGNLV